MKPITISPLSFLLGSITAAGLVVVLGFQEINRRAADEIPASAVVLGMGPISVVGIPDPRDIIVIEEGTPFVVPACHKFVATGIGTTNPGGQTSPGAAILVDGVTMAALSPPTAGFSFLSLSTAIVADEGSVVESTDFNASVGTPRIYGYLIDA